MNEAFFINYAKVLIWNILSNLGVIYYVSYLTLSGLQFQRKAMEA